MAIKIDNRVSLTEAQHAIQASEKRLDAAMARSANGARDAATLSKPEVRDEILNKAGSAGEFKALDAMVYDTAVKIAKSRNSGQVGASELKQAANSWMLAARSASKGDGFLGQVRDTSTAGLKAIYAAASKHEDLTAGNRARASKPELLK
ncbi:MAG: hypothetical protein H6730_27840 [Deltaproteobacteria bacterium]|nr:hypothetical protein [Deltaproteobacteria bacterium]